MQLRWSATIALWTILSGPVLNNHGVFTAPSREPAKQIHQKDHKPHKERAKKNVLAKQP